MGVVEYRGFDDVRSLSRLSATESGDRVCLIMSKAKTDLRVLLTRSRGDIRAAELTELLNASGSLPEGQWVRLSEDLSFMLCGACKSLTVPLMRCRYTAFTYLPSDEGITLYESDFDRVTRRPFVEVVPTVFWRAEAVPPPRRKQRSARSYWRYRFETEAPDAYEDGALTLCCDGYNVPVTREMLNRENGVYLPARNDGQPSAPRVADGGVNLQKTS